MLKIIKAWHQPIHDMSRYDSLVDNRPYLGFCLGHQFLAEALGAKVALNFRPSFGIVTGYLTHYGRSHPAFAVLPESMPSFK